MFDGPEYVPYIQLCRELRLKRTWATGDWFWSGDASVIARWDDGPEYGGEEPFWLPRLDQWLSMLEGRGVVTVTLRWMHGPVWMAFEEHHDDSGCVPEDYQEPGFGSTREEACARLCLAVTGGRTA